MKRRVRISALAFCAALCGCGADGEFPALRGPYLGQTPPGTEPALFAPGIVSTGLYERDLAVTPDGGEIFYGLVFGRQAVIMHTRLAGGRWTEPEVAPFSRDLAFLYLEPALSPDGGRVYFLSTKPPAGEEPKPGWTNQNIWMSERAADGSWGEARIVEAPVSTADEEYFPSLTRDGTIYFARRPDGSRRDRIYRARLEGGSYAAAEPLPEVVNGDWTIYNAFIAPDESYLVACVAGKDPEITKGLAHYYVFFRDGDDRWSEGVHLGEKINPPLAQAMSPSITPDGRYFFFASTMANGIDAGAPGMLTLGGIRRFYDAPKNGLFDIYWVDASVIHDLRKSSSD
ncbi:MAG: hypothetical protein C4574_05585 [Candidatus Latescibacterota bacterium]|jgi:hypothetical protein|nr:MAG: hypothetical protein C4574_05585 [Candidatus Latescibacterota bacterium]